MARFRRWGIGVACLAVAFLLMGAAAAFAAPTTADQAKRAALGWAALGDHLGDKMSGGVLKVESFRGTGGTNLFYVVRLASGSVILPADDRIEPIVAFLPGGTYDDLSENCLKALVRADLEKRFQALDAAGEKKEAAWNANAAKWQALGAGVAGKAGLASVSDVRVAPLLASKWDQAEAYPGGPLCYNYYTPNNYVCGCVATAMAQIMYFHRYPTAGVGTASFPITVGGVAQTANLRGGDGAGGAYQWTTMVADPDATITDAQCAAIGALTYDAGVAAHMAYDTTANGGSGADTLLAVKQLVDVFLYANARTGYSGAQNATIPSAILYNMVNSNLDASLPVALAIYDPSSGGHAIVCDGYGYEGSTPYHHLNMGWSGTDDVWYNLPNIDVAGMPFTVVRGCGYNIYPNGSGEIVSGRVFDSSNNLVSGATVTATGGGLTYTATSSGNGVYALRGLPSNTTYTITASSGGSISVNVGTSVNDGTTTGNVWAADINGGVVVPTPTPNPSGAPTITEFSASPTNPAVGVEVTFYANATDPNGGSVTYQMAFGDGGTAGPNTFPSGERVNATHSYSSRGTYTVTLTASNASGSVTRTLTVTVGGGGGGGGGGCDAMALLPALALLAPLPLLRMRRK